MIFIEDLITIEDDDTFDRILDITDTNPNVTIWAHRNIREGIMLDLNYWKTTSFIIIDGQGKFQHINTTKSIPLNGLIGAIWKQVKEYGVKAFSSFGISSDFDKKSEIMKHFGKYYNIITDSKENRSLPNKSYIEKEYQQRVCEDDRIRIYDENGLLDYKIIGKLCQRIALHLWNKDCTILEVVTQKSIYPMCNTKPELERMIKQNITEEEYFKSVIQLGKIFNKVMKEEKIQ